MNPVVIGYSGNALARMGLSTMRIGMQVDYQIFDNISFAIHSAKKQARHVFLILNISREDNIPGVFEIAQNLNNPFFSLVFILPDSLAGLGLRVSEIPGIRCSLLKSQNDGIDSQLKTIFQLGEMYIDTSFTDSRIEHEPLSPRETELLALAAEGMLNKEIAARLDISRQTVKNHFSSVYSKFGSNGRIESIKLARFYGYI